AQDGAGAAERELSVAVRDRVPNREVVLRRPHAVGVVTVADADGDVAELGAARLEERAPHALAAPLDPEHLAEPRRLAHPGWRQRHVARVPSRTREGLVQLAEKGGHVVTRAEPRLEALACDSPEVALERAASDGAPREDVVERAARVDVRVDPARHGDEARAFGRGAREAM